MISESWKLSVSGANYGDRNNDNEDRSHFNQNGNFINDIKLNYCVIRFDSIRITFELAGIFGVILTINFFRTTKTNNADNKEERWPLGARTAGNEHQQFIWIGWTFRKVHLDIYDSDQHLLFRSSNLWPLQILVESSPTVAEVEFAIYQHIFRIYRSMGCLRFSIFTVMLRSEALDMTPLQACPLRSRNYDMIYHHVNGFWSDDLNQGKISSYDGFRGLASKVKERFVYSATDTRSRLLAGINVATYQVTDSHHHNI